MHGWRDLPVRGVVPFVGDVDRNHHGAEFSIPVSVLHQSSGKFCVYLYLGFAALLPEYHLHAFVVHVLHSLVGRNQSLSKFYVRSQMFCDVELCEVDIAVGITPQQPCHFHRRNRIRNTLKIVSVVVYAFLTPP
jgi:hypothetical protein